MRKNTVMFILFISFLISTLGNSSKAESSNTEPFVFRDAITWGMSESEITAIEGSQFEKEDFSNLELLFYKNRMISNYNAMLAYGFHHNSLVMTMYQIDDFSKDVFDNLFLAYTTKYGERKHSGKTDYIEFFSKFWPESYFYNHILTLDEDLFYEWTTSDATKILFIWDDVVAEYETNKSASDYEPGTAYAESESVGPENMTVEIFYVSPIFPDVSDINLFGV